MFNFLPALILLIVQGSCGSEVAPRHLGLLMDLATRSQSGTPQAQATREETRELLRLLGNEEGRTLLSQAGLTVWGLAFAAAMGDEPAQFEIPAIQEGESGPPLLAPPSLGRLTDGHEHSGRTRDGPAA